MGPSRSEHIWRCYPWLSCLQPLDISYPNLSVDLCALTQPNLLHSPKATSGSSFISSAFLFFFFMCLFTSQVTLYSGTLNLYSHSLLSKSKTAYWKHILGKNSWGTINSLLVVVLAPTGAYIWVVWWELLLMLDDSQNQINEWASVLSLQMDSQPAFIHLTHSDTTGTTFEVAHRLDSEIRIGDLSPVAGQCSGTLRHDASCPLTFSPQSIFPG